MFFVALKHFIQYNLFLFLFQPKQLINIDDFNSIDIPGLIRLKCMNLKENCQGIMFIEKDSNGFFKCELCSKYNCMDCNVSTYYLSPCI